MPKIKNPTGKFVKYSFWGAVWSALSIFLAWLFVDHAGMSAFAASTLLVAIGIIARFLMYKTAGIVSGRFFNFASTEIAFSLLNILLMTITIDIMKIKTLISAPIIIISLFLLKFKVHSRNSLH
jgi:hypothetical protein